MSEVHSKLPESVISVAGHDAIDEKIAADVITTTDDAKVTTSSFSGAGDNGDVVIVTGADAATYLLPMRDDGDPALTFRSLVLASGLACFQAVMNQIYNVCKSMFCLTSLCFS